jgi:hypothetical protein
MARITTSESKALKKYYLLNRFLLKLKKKNLFFKLFTFRSFLRISFSLISFNIGYIYYSLNYISLIISSKFSVKLSPQENFSFDIIYFSLSKSSEKSFNSLNESFFKKYLKIKNYKLLFKINFI